MTTPHPVIDEHTPADGRAGVDFDTGEETSEMRNQATQPTQTARPQPVRKTMQGDGMHARIAGQHLPESARGGITLEN
jgi:hypothetical protein